MDEPSQDELLLRYRKRSEEKLKVLVVFIVVFFILALWFLISDEL